VIVAVLSAFPVAAQESSVADAADRPGFADSPVLLGRGHVQIEFGFTTDHEDGDAGVVRSFTAPQTELHAGVFSRVDISVSWDGFVSATASPSQAGTEEHDTGYADVRLGAKLALVHRPRLDTTLITYVNAPVGSAFVTDHYSDPTARLAWGIAISDRVDVSGTIDLKAVRDEDDHVHAKPAAKCRRLQRAHRRAQWIRRSRRRTRVATFEAKSRVGRGGPGPAVRGPQPDGRLGEPPVHRRSR
jgi:hypothetical protein